MTVTTTMTMDVDDSAFQKLLLTYVPKHPLIEKFEHTKNKTLEELIKIDRMQYKALRNSCFKDLHEIRNYLCATNPETDFIGRNHEKAKKRVKEFLEIKLSPRQAKRIAELSIEEKMKRAQYHQVATINGYADHNHIRDPYLILACLHFLKVYYGENYHKEIKQIWKHPKRGEDMIKSEIAKSLKTGEQIISIAHLSLEGVEQFVRGKDTCGFGGRSPYVGGRIPFPTKQIA